MSTFNDKENIEKDWLSVERGGAFKCCDREDNGWLVVSVPELGRIEHPRESSVKMSSTYKFPGIHHSEKLEMDNQVCEIGASCAYVHMHWRCILRPVPNV